MSGVPAFKVIMSATDSLGLLEVNMLSSISFLYCAFFHIVDIPSGLITIYQFHVIQERPTKYYDHSRGSSQCLFSL